MQGDDYKFTLIVPLSLSLSFKLSLVGHRVLRLVDAVDGGVVTGHLNKDSFH